MFALALYDARSSQLHLARDRAGEKPLFYRKMGQELWFASEVQALLAVGSPRKLDQTALRQYARFGYVTEPRTMFTDIEKVEAGTTLTVSDHSSRIARYWDAHAEARRQHPMEHTREQLENLLLQAVSKQLVADVPVGVFTSGGIDSGLLTAMAVAARGKQRIHTFTIGFSEPHYDESPYGEQLARYLGTEHETVRTNERVLLDAMNTVIDSVAEPISDPAVLPTYLLAKAARERVTVVLGGEGADELFGGYPTYLGHRLARHVKRLPGAARRLFRWAAHVAPTSATGKVPLEYLAKRFTASAELPFQERHLQWFGTGLDPSSLTAEAVADDQVAPEFPPDGDPIWRAGLFDYCTYLRDNLLTKVDRATMLSSLESRAPYLDPEVTRFGLTLNSLQKVRGLRTKCLLKQVASRWLPRHIVNRRKRGLSVPIGQWLNGTLRGDVDRLLSPERVGDRGLLRPDAVQQLVTQHRSGRANHSRALWPLLVLEYWIERWA
jgi:asparagine synthase (glutamine-hydrolysing)